MAISLSALQALYKQAAQAPQMDPGSQAMALAAQAAKPPGAPPLPKPIQQEDPAGQALSAEQQEMEKEKLEEQRRAELAKKDNEIHALQGELQKAQIENDRAKAEAAIAAREQKSREALRAEREKLEQQKAQAESEETNRRTLANAEEIKHQAQLDKQTANQQVTIAQDKAKALMDIANQNAQSYVKTTDEARRKADEYYEGRKTQLDQQRATMSPALESQMTGAIAAMKNIGKLRNKGKLTAPAIKMACIPNPASAPTMIKNSYRQVETTTTGGTFGLTKHRRALARVLGGWDRIENTSAPEWALIQARLENELEKAKGTGYEATLRDAVEGARFYRTRYDQQLNQWAKQRDVRYAAEREQNWRDSLDTKRTNVHYNMPVVGWVLDEDGVPGTLDRIAKDPANQLWYMLSGRSSKQESQLDNIRNQYNDEKRKESWFNPNRWWNAYMAPVENSIRQPIEDIRQSNQLAEQFGVEPTWFGPDKGTLAAREEYQNALEQRGLWSSRWGQLLGLGLGGLDMQARASAGLMGVGLASDLGHLAYYTRQGRKAGQTWGDAWRNARTANKARLDTQQNNLANKPGISGKIRRAAFKARHPFRAGKFGKFMSAVNLGFIGTDLLSHVFGHQRKPGTIDSSQLETPYLDEGIDRLKKNASITQTHTTQVSNSQPTKLQVAQPSISQPVNLSTTSQSIPQPAQVPSISTNLSPGLVNWTSTDNSNNKTLTQLNLSQEAANWKMPSTNLDTSMIHQQIGPANFVADAWKRTAYIPQPLSSMTAQMLNAGYDGMQAGTSAYNAPFGDRLSYWMRTLNPYVSGMTGGLIRLADSGRVPYNTHMPLFDVNDPNGARAYGQAIMKNTAVDPRFSQYRTFSTPGAVAIAAAQNEQNKDSFQKPFNAAYALPSGFNS